MRCYLAGPDVFHPDAVALGAAKKALCAARGIEGLFPLDDEGLAAAPTSAAIYAGCREMMARADVGIFNLTPFRGVSADVGTVFELGFMAARGKPVFAYTNDPDDLIARLGRSGDLVRDAAGIWRDAHGLMAEDFGNADNLMIDETLAAQGRRVHRRAVPPDRLWHDLDGFAACLDEAVRALGANASPA